MTDNTQNLNIGKYNSTGISTGRNQSYAYEGQIRQSEINQPANSKIECKNAPCKIEPETDNPLHMRLNALDSTLLEKEAYRDIDDEVLKTEYRINKLEEEIKSIDTEIQNAKSINDFQKVDILVMRKHTLQNNLKTLYESYGKTDITAKLSENIASALNTNPSFLIKVYNSVKNFISEKFLSKISKKFNSGEAIKKALTKLETLNRNVDELVTMQTPYGEADERYDRLSNYLNSANIIHFQISKIAGTPVFLDTISSIDKEKLKSIPVKSNFGNMTGKHQ